jgi:hypothetical protein
MLYVIAVLAMSALIVIVPAVELVKTLRSR